jgi:hypothetical protein
MRSGGTRGLAVGRLLLPLATALFLTGFARRAGFAVRASGFSGFAASRILPVVSPFIAGRAGICATALARHFGRASLSSHRIGSGDITHRDRRRLGVGGRRVPVE